MAKLKLGIVGCGAVTELCHLPAALASDQVEVSILVDSARQRAQQLADDFGVRAIAEDCRELLGIIDAAIVAVPNGLHAAVTVELLRQGISVLVEKPMAVTVAECDRMIQAANDTGAVLAVGMSRRFYLSSKFIKVLLESRVLGEIVSFEWREGSIFNWPVSSPALFSKDLAGGGVLMDVGVHVLDLLLWWFGDCARVEYFDDARGGVESDCEARLSFKSGVSGTMELSRARNLPNVCTLYGKRGNLEFGTKVNPTLRLSVPETSSRLVGQIASLEGTVDTTFSDVFLRQLHDFIAAIVMRQSPSVSGRDGERTVQLIETCYTCRQPLFYLWEGAKVTRVENAG